MSRRCTSSFSSAHFDEHTVGKRRNFMIMRRNPVQMQEDEKEEDEEKDEDEEKGAPTALCPGTQHVFYRAGPRLFPTYLALTAPLPYSSG
jgi:hypothetical protein